MSGAGQQRRSCIRTIVLLIFIISHPKAEVLTYINTSLITKNFSLLRWTKEVWPSKKFLFIWFQLEKIFFLRVIGFFCQLKSNLDYQGKGKRFLIAPQLREVWSFKHMEVTLLRLLVNFDSWLPNWPPSFIWAPSGHILYGIWWHRTSSKNWKKFRLSNPEIPTNFALFKYSFDRLPPSEKMVRMTLLVTRKRAPLKLSLVYIINNNKMPRVKSPVTFVLCATTELSQPVCLLTKDFVLHQRSTLFLPLRMYAVTAKARNWQKTTRNFRCHNKKAHWLHAVQTSGRNGSVRSDARWHFWKDGHRRRALNRDL